MQAKTETSFIHFIKYSLKIQHLAKILDLEGQAQ